MFAINGEITPPCPSGRLLATTRPSMPPLVGLFDRRFQPHLDEMQHLPIADATRDALHQF